MDIRTIDLLSISGAAFNQSAKRQVSHSAASSIQFCATVTECSHTMVSEVTEYAHTMVPEMGGIRKSDIRTRTGEWGGGRTSYITGGDSDSLITVRFSVDDNRSSPLRVDSNRRLSVKSFQPIETLGESSTYHSSELSSVVDVTSFNYSWDPV